MKKCTICNEEKNLEEFGNRKGFKDGRYPQCRPCKSIKDKEYYQKNLEIRKQKANEYYKNNKQQILASVDKLKRKKYRKKYIQEKKEELSIYSKNYKLINADSIKIQRQKYRKENKTKIRQDFNERRNEDPLFKLGLTIRKRLNEVLKIKNINKSKRFHEYIGCDLETLKLHLESQFTSEMNWQNHGKVWHIDHIIPLSAAKNEHHIYELSHYKNLQPLLKEDNLKKNDSIIKCWQKFQKEKQEDIDKQSGFPFNLNISNFIFSFETLTLEHKTFIQKYEWLGTIGFGVRWVFTARWNNHLAGIVMLSEPNSYQFGKEEVLIQRGAVSSWAPKNLNSKLVMFSCKWMVRNTHKRIFTAYSDTTAGEIGTIYQACNFDYLGQDYGSSFYFKLDNGKLVTSRYFTRTSSMKKWAKEIGIKWDKSWEKENGFQNPLLVPQELKNYAKKQMNKYPKVKQLSKHKYVLLINHGKTKIIKNWQSNPYPKRINK